MAVAIVQAFDASGKPYTCSASMVYDSDMMTLARKLASEAIGEGLAFGSSQSRRDPRHVASLVLSDASRLYYFGKLAHVQDEQGVDA
jgi:hypothetical protein